MSSDARIAAVILAAGASTRLGQAKQRVRIGKSEGAEGETLLHRTARLALEAGCSPVLVVLGYEAEQMVGELEGLAAEAVVNREWVEGMGSSLRCGVEAVRGLDPMPQAVLVLVCDQPRLTVEHLQALILQHKTGEHRTGEHRTGEHRTGEHRTGEHRTGEHRTGENRRGKAAITASVYAGRMGVPAVFGAELFAELAASGGDRGARDLIRRYSDLAQGLPWPEGTVDLDLPNDLRGIE